MPLGIRMLNGERRAARNLRRQIGSLGRAAGGAINEPEAGRANGGDKAIDLIAGCLIFDSSAIKTNNGRLEFPTDAFYDSSDVFLLLVATHEVPRDQCSGYSQRRVSDDPDNYGEHACC